MTEEFICDSCGAEAKPIYDSAALGERGAFDLICDCGWSFFVPAEATARSRIAKLRGIANEHHAARIDGCIVDATTASLLVKVYDALTPANREKFGHPPITRLVDLAWKVAR